MDVDGEILLTVVIGFISGIAACILWQDRLQLMDLVVSKAKVAKSVIQNLRPAKPGDKRRTSDFTKQNTSKLIEDKRAQQTNGINSSDSST